jgi:antitoxin component YwqK of YwqJK toxin-antitoxin module
MRYFTLIIIAFFSLAFQSCKTSLTDYATDWSNNIKTKIIEDVNQQPDKIVFDSSSYNVTLYKEGKKLKFYHLNPKFSDNGQLLSLDTAVSIFYSTDQNFELVRELCKVNDRSFEGIRYKGNHLGLAEFRYCNGKLKESGFRFNGEVGIWKEYDTIGKVIKETDQGDFSRLEKLKDIKYYR